MSDLSVWDLANDFSGKEAAALIVGEKPPSVSGNWQPVIDRMIRSYQSAVNWHIGAVVCDPEHCETRPAEMLESIEMRWRENPDDIEESRVPHVFHSWLADSTRSGFDLQRFKRDEITQWLEAIGHKSVYQFQVKGPGRDAAGSEKVLGTRERDTLLTIIAALAKQAKIDVNAPGKAALTIEGWTTEIEAHVSKRAIEEHLKKIPDALATRLK